MTSLLSNFSFFLPFFLSSNTQRLCVIEAAVGKLVEYSADAIKNQVSYLCCYSCNVQNLIDEVGELNNKYDSAKQEVVAARANLGVITPEVEAWLRKVEELKTESDKILGDVEEVKRNSFCKWFPVLHYSLSRKALKTTNDSAKLRNAKFDKIFNPMIPADIPPVPTTSNVRFESRDSMEGRIVDALKDPSVYSIGIWGIGGVGKTVMAKKIKERVRDEKFLFEHVVMAVVSQQPDLLRIQSQIARELGLSLASEESPESRQRKMHHRLMAEKGILIILDDLWERLDLEELGIPSQSTHAGCKLILTSRNKDALISTGVLVRNIFRLGILTEEESWRFFKDNAGISVNDDSHDELVQIAKKVERECMGLPLALKIVACALKGKDISFWNNAVRELKKHVPDNIPGVTKGVYGSLLFSINALEVEEQKDLFLLCCLFPEDYLISIEEIWRCVMGLGIFKELENLIEVRDKVETVLNILLCRSLLTEGDGQQDNFYVRMHDVIRDVGIWIATKGKLKHVFLIKHGVNEWPTQEDDSFSNCTCISLLFSHCSISFPESIVCPKLEFLRLDSLVKWNYHVELPENFLSGMVGLRVLEALHIQLLPSSVGQLNNLRTLSLQQCRIFETISVLGKLINLEMLSLRKCEFKVLPTEIGGLKKLKQMNILGCPQLRRIAFGVVSGLARLEELMILDSFDNWESEARGEEDVACLSELNGLKNLTTLKIEIRNPSVVPKQKPLWVQKVKKYYIAVSTSTYSEKVRFQKSIVLGRNVENLLGGWIYNMASDAEYVVLEGSNCMKFVEGLPENFGNLRFLKELRLFEFTNIQYLAQRLQNGAIFPILQSLYIEDSDSLQQIFEVSPPTGSFVALQRIYLYKLSGLVCLWKFSIKEQLDLGNLKAVSICQCDSLSYLFSLSVCQSLVQLTDLCVSNCRTIEEIFKREDGELVGIDKITLPKLTDIEFSGLDSFYGLCNEIDRIELPNLCWLRLHGLPRMKMAEGDNNEVHQKYLISKGVQAAGISCNFCWLHRLEVHRIGNFKCLFSSSVIISGLLNLSFLWVEDCSMLEEIIGKDDEKVKRVIKFPNLTRLWLFNLPNIRTFCYNLIEFPSLEYLTIRECPLMLKFVEEFTNHIPSSRSFLDEQVQCPKLNELSLSKLNKISGAFSPLFFKSLTVLKHLSLSCCDGLEHMITKEEGQIATNTEKEFIKRIPLKTFHLFQLPKLYGSIFRMKHNLEFPLLDKVEIEDCPMLEKFSLGSLHLPNLTRVKGLLNAEFATNIFFHKEISPGEIYLENNCFLISIKDISFNFNHPNGSRFVTPNSSESFLDAVEIHSYEMREGIVGKFKIENIREGIEYEVMLMVMVMITITSVHESEDLMVIELKLFEGSKLQRKEILKNHPTGTWIEISIGKFMRESQQSEQFEFSLHLSSISERHSRILCIKGIRIVEV